MTLTEHAILRYRDRVKPMLAFKGAKGELTALLDMAAWEKRDGYPAWYVPGDEPPSNYEGWIELSDGIAALVSEEQVVTVVVRAGMHPTLRAARNRRKAAQRAARLHRSKSNGQRRSGRPQVEPAWD